MNDLEQLQTGIEDFLLSSHSAADDADECPIQWAAITRVRPRTAGEATGIEIKLRRLLSGLEGREGKKGVSIFIGMPEIARMEPNIRALTGSCAVVIEVSENILVNMGEGGTQKGAEEFALAVAELLNHQPFALWSPLRVKSILPNAEAVLDKRAAYNVTVETDLRRPKKPKVEMPSIALAADVMTLACATSGAAIHYTLDGSFPGPSNEESLLYATPVTLASGTHELRVAAWKAGFAGSVQVSQTVTV